MPVDPHYRHPDILFQRQQYAKGGLGRWYWDWRDKMVLDCLESGDQDILDLGCGEGITLERLIKSFPGRNIQGIDIMPENVAISQSHHLPVRLGDLYALDLPNSSQDAVLLLEVIEHLLDPERAIREIHRVLRPGGKLLVMFPNDRTFFWARLFTLRFQEAFYDPGHMRQWTSTAMIDFLTCLGFQAKALKVIPFHLWMISLHGLVTAVKKQEA